MECPAKYDLQYRQKIRPVRQPSYFVFGSALDKGFNELLLGKPMEEAIKAMKQELGRLLKEPVEFFFNDYDSELFSDETKDRLLKECNKAGYPGDNIEALVALFDKEIDTLSPKQAKCLGILCHASLLEKALLMLSTYQKKVLPRLSEIKNVQLEVKWKDHLNNEFVMVEDFEANLDGIPVTADNKTSAPRVYNENSVKTSIQFAVYTSKTGVNRCAYFVLNKAIQKNRVKTCSKCGNDGTGKQHRTCDKEIEGVRCKGDWNQTIDPEALVEIWVDEVPEAEQKLVQEALTGFAEAVKAEVFPKNLKSCIQKFGNRESKCPYYDYCRSGSMKGLEKKK